MISFPSSARSHRFRKLRRALQTQSNPTRILIYLIKKRLFPGFPNKNRKSKQVDFRLKQQHHYFHAGGRQLETKAKDHYSFLSFSTKSHSLKSRSVFFFFSLKKTITMLISPTPLSLICAVMLCMPLAVVFTVTSPTTVSIQSPKSSTITHRKLNLTPLLSPPPPPPLPLDDVSLLRIAATVNSRPPRFKKPKIAFMFLTTTPLPFAPLWEEFFRNAPKSLYRVYVHADPRFPYQPPFSGVFAGRVIHSKPAQRFTPTLVSATRRLLAHSLLDDPMNSMFALLTPSCIPLHSFNFTYRTLAASRRSFIEILENEVGAYDRWVARGEDAMLPQVSLEEFRIGSQFWVLKRKHARLVVSDQRLWSKFKLPCERWDTCYPEENYFPTLLHMRDPGGCVPATLTHVDWNGRFDGHPVTYNATDVGPDLIWSLREERPRYGDEVNVNATEWSGSERHDPFLFARKFPPDAVEPLMSMASDVIFRD